MVVESADETESEAVSFVQRAVTDVAAVFATIDAETALLSKATGIKCRVGCGACCTKPGIEASVVELLPAALALLTEGVGDVVYERAGADPDGICVFYQAAEVGVMTRGACTRYATRPAVCRLFGFAAFREKDGRPVLASCVPHKEDQPERLAAANGQFAAGTLAAPLFVDFGLQLDGIAGHSALSEKMPLNRALTQAIERVELSLRHVP